MKKLLFTCYLLFFTIAQIFAQKIEIQSNKLISDINIKITNKNSTILLPKDVLFSLEEYGLKANNLKLSTVFKAISMTNVSGAMKEFKSGKINAYDIVITNPRFSKTYYGKIAFFNVLKANENDAVARYREISIDDSYFSSATNGRVAITYEYSAVRNGLTGNTTEVPTWVIMLSDVPFK